MASIKIIVRAEKMRKNGEVPLYIRMTSSGKSKYISLGQTIPPKTWDTDREKVRKSHPNSARLNAFLTDRKAEISALALDVDQGRKKVGRNSMRDALANGSGESFFAYGDEFLASLKRQSRIATFRNYNIALNDLKKWLSKDKGRDDLSFSRLTHELAKEFQTYLEKELGNSAKTVLSKFAALKSILSSARDAGIVERGFLPFGGLKIRVKKKKKQIPSREEISQLQMLDVKQDSLSWHTRNLYLFCANMAGLRFGDAVTLRWANVVGNRLQWQTRKTDKQRLIYIPEEAREILDQYRNEVNEPIEFIFPFLAGCGDLSQEGMHRKINTVNSNSNARLRKMWRQAGCSEEYSFHTSRHFFATDSLRRGMRVEVLQHILTHSSLDQTMEYAQIANDDMDSAMKAYEVAKNA